MKSLIFYFIYFTCEKQIIVIKDDVQIIHLFRKMISSKILILPIPVYQLTSVNIFSLSTTIANDLFPQTIQSDYLTY